MSFIDILKLVGFSTGAFLHFYIAWLIWSRRRYGASQLRHSERSNAQQKPATAIGKHALTPSERTFVMLGLCLGAWFLGNLLKTLQELIRGDPGRGTEWLRIWETITVLGVALFPSALLQSHIAFWSWLDGYRTLSRRAAAFAGIACYLPMMFLPYTILAINTGAYQDYFLKLRWFLLPYSIWQIIAFWASAIIDWRMKDRLYASAESERRFFSLLSIMLFVIGAFQFVVVGLRGSGPTDILWLPYILFSLLPTFTIAYYIYRYNLYELVIKGSLVYAAFAVIFITVYTYGIRRLDQFLVDSYEIKPAVIEAILILGMTALAGPAVRLIDRTVRRLFSREIGVYRAVVRQVSQGAAGFGEIESLIRYSEEIIRTGLDLDRVRIVRTDGSSIDGPVERLAAEMARTQTDILEDDRALAESDATIAYALNRDDRSIGLMLVTAEPRTLTSEKRAVLEVLAGQVAIELEGCLLVEEKVRLERELAGRERFAALGQLAATIAHEVKNPLSSIKLITQVMREDKALSGYDRDLQLIVGEIDRLNHTVSQLLSFSRPSRIENARQPTNIREIVDSVIELTRPEAVDRRIKLVASITGLEAIRVSQSAALREVLSNLILNALQAAPGGGTVTVQASIEKQYSPDNLVTSHATPSRIETSRGGGKSTSHALGRSWLNISVTDTGPGIALSDQTRVFEPFFTTKPRGTGLGLSIVQRRVAELGGTVELVSPAAEGSGAMFKIRMPIPRSEGDE